jgi:hypothetical protein
MKLISNKTIVVLLSVALLISAGKVVLDLGKMGSFSSNLLTGAATSSPVTGVVNLTINSNTAITNQVAAIEFGSGSVNGSCTECQMDSNGFNNQTGPCCAGFANVSSGFLLENTGNLNLSVYYNCSGNCTAETLIGGSAPRFELKVTNNNAASQSGEGGAADTANSCDAFSNVVFGGWNISDIEGVNSSFLEATYVNVSSNQSAWICGNLTHFPLDFTNTQDAAVVDINLSIPLNAPGTDALSNATFTFTGISNG